MEKTRYRGFFAGSSQLLTDPRLTVTDDLFRGFKKGSRRPSVHWPRRHNALLRMDNNLRATGIDIQSAARNPWQARSIPGLRFRTSENRQLPSVNGQ
jgi:hypothetical protein